jgi:hypothetical protein
MLYYNNINDKSYTMSTNRIPRKKGTTGMYFTEETQQAVIQYASTDDEIKRNIIFNRHLYKPIKKIVEIYKNKVDTPYASMYYTDTELMHDCIAHIATNLSGFNKGKGKAFSYISISARNHFIQLNDRCYIQYKHHSKLEEENGNIIDESYDTDEYNKEYLEMYYSFHKWCSQNIDKIGLSTRSQKTVSDVLEFMDDFDEVDKYYTLYATNVFLSKWDMSKTSWFKARHILAILWEQWKKNWDGESGGWPTYTTVAQTDLDTKTIEWIKEFYERGTQTRGITKISKILGVSCEVVSKVVKEYNL